MTGNARRSAVNPSTGDVETLLEEGETGGRRWEVIDCVHYGRYDQTFPDAWQADDFRPDFMTYRMVRISLADVGVESYVSMLVKDWSRLYEMLAEMKDPSGKSYNPKFNFQPSALYRGGKDDFYVEFTAGDAPEGGYGGMVEHFLKELSPVLVAMAVAGPSELSWNASAKEGQQ